VVNDCIQNANNLPVQTNKFYANFFLGAQGGYTWTHPYSVAWSKGGGNAQSWGLAISHYGEDQKVLGDPSNRIPGSPMKFFFSPVGIQSIILSATELESTTTLTTDTFTAFSINVNLRPAPHTQSKITFPLVQGMGFVTGQYTKLTPTIQTSVFFRNLEAAGSPKQGVFKYRLTLEDGKLWLVYIIPDSGQDPKLQKISNTLCRGQPGFSGIIQVAKNPIGRPGGAIYDAAVGAYAVRAEVTGAVAGTDGSYSLKWTKSGENNSKLLMFALPHHVASFDEVTRACMKDLKLATTTKGWATSIIADSWTMRERDLPISMDFAPYDVQRGPVSNLSHSAQVAIGKIAIHEAADDLVALKNEPSMYFGGKRAHKAARIVYTIHDLLKDPHTAEPGLQRLKDAVGLFSSNKQAHPLVYDEAWKGIVSDAGYPPGQPLEDFGNTYYNDHHFHYAYWIHTAALIAHMDPSWGAKNRDWVNSLVKDACNPIDDAQFPFSRNFDWYHGHSWAHGLFEFGDGKDLESTSEDMQFAYAIKMWGKVSGDKSMEARGNLMLKILARTLNSYFLMDSENTIMPKQFIGNKVCGILFENKCDHATFFDGNLWAIQGIHMLPLIPASSLIRTKKFVQEEWDAFFRPGAAEPVDKVPNFWRGVIMANLALIHPKASWDFFIRSDWNEVWLDNGQSRTWSLAMAAGELPMESQ
jgi:endo-1,3(4)-beta-glucanase